MSIEVSMMTAADGRTLEVLTAGDPGGFPWLFHGGSPSAVVPSARLDQVARAHGVRLVTWSRPGYGGSTVRPRGDGVGPRMADDVADAVAVLDALGADRFLTAGWSGGGPRALACAALLPERCLAAATLAGVAPHDGAGLDWSAGMAPENVAEYAAAERGPQAYAALLTEGFLPMAQVTGEQIAEGLGQLLTPVDRAAVTGDLAEFLAATMRRALVQGVVGARDDGLAAVAPWGFELSAIAVPVAVWQGREDAMVPFAHGAWLAAHVPGARAHLLDGEGHLTVLDRLPEVLTELRSLAGV